jgi:membrane-bound metal-dependent hydrolase YbcI (DUF457 family)
MKVPEHLALSFLLAQLGVQQHNGWAGTGLMLAAGCLPDLDGLTLLAGWRVYRRRHRVLGHGLPLTLCGPALLAFIGSELLALGPFLPLWGWLQVALLAHLFTDVCFYRWPVQLLWPVSAWGCGCGLLTWNDLVPTLFLYSGTVIALWWPKLALLAASLSVAGLLGYLAWRAVRPRQPDGWTGWLTGGWAPQAAPVWRWLTGDFIT